MSVSSPVEVWRCPHSGRTVTLVGTIHFADPAYFRGVAAFIRRLDRAGAEVHYESVSGPLHDDMTDRERELVARLAAAAPSSRDVAALVGLAHQSVIALEPHWVRTDATLLDVVRALRDPEALAARWEEMSAQFAEHAHVVGPVLRWVVRRWWLLQLLGWLGRLAPGNRDVRVAVVDRRDQIAARAALAADRDVVAVWGAGHLPGIGALLAAGGFRRVRRGRLDSGTEARLAAAR